MFCTSWSEPGTGWVMFYWKTLIKRFLHDKPTVWYKNVYCNNSFFNAFKLKMYEFASQSTHANFGSGVELNKDSRLWFVPRVQLPSWHNRTLRLEHLKRNDEKNALFLPISILLFQPRLKILIMFSADFRLKIFKWILLDSIKEC